MGTEEFQWNSSFLVKYLLSREATWITLTRLVAIHDSALRIHGRMVAPLMLTEKAIYLILSPSFSKMLTRLQLTWIYLWYLTLYYRSLNSCHFFIYTSTSSLVFILYFHLCRFIYIYIFFYISSIFIYIEYIFSFLYIYIYQSSRIINDQSK